MKKNIPTTVSIRVSRSFYAIAKKASKNENRSASGQIIYWARIGKKHLDNNTSIKVNK